MGLLLVGVVLYTHQQQERQRFRRHYLCSLGHPTTLVDQQRLWQPTTGCRLAAKWLRPWSAVRRRAALSAPRELPELSIVPVWELYLPQALVLLILAYAAGRDIDVLYYMV